MESIVNRLMKAGTRRGFQGSQPWMIVAIVAATIRVLRRLSSPKPDVVWRQAMQAGDRFEVTVTGEPGRRKSK